jgi:hypothetical protein
MYKIIGADQKEYGPVTADQIRQWIAEGRANPASRVQIEGSGEWVALSSLPEFAEALAAKAPPPVPVTPPPPSDPEALAAYIRTRDYEIDIGHCVSRSWALWKEHAGLLIGATAVFFVLFFVTTQLLGLFSRPAIQSLIEGNISLGPILVLLLLNIPQMALSKVLSAGVYVLLLRLIRGQPAGMGDLFAGFRSSFMQLAAAGIVVQLLTALGSLACLLPGIYLSIAWILTVPLIVDRRLDFWAAMELSRKVVTQHWWLMFCLLIVMVLINVVGFLACCVGLLASFPLGLGALMYAYEDIFSEPGSAPH